MELLYLPVLLSLLGLPVESFDVTAPMMMMPVIDSLDVKCSKTGMLVDLTFSAPFTGIVYSKGHFSNPACRYVSANSNRTSYQLLLEAGTCGMEQTVSVDKTQLMSTTIVIQNDIQYQEIWDTARRLTCEWADRISKKISVSSFRVSMLDTIEAKFAGEGESIIDIWMDIRGGMYPNNVELNDDPVCIGDPLSVIVGARDTDSAVDIQVQDCYAHSDPDPFFPDSAKFQLTDFNGCVLKEKLISPFVSFKGVGRDAGNIVLVGVMNAFSFPDSSDVYTSCNVEICKGRCEPRACGGTVTKSSLTESTVKVVKVVSATTSRPVTFETTTLTQLLTTPAEIVVTSATTLQPVIVDEAECFPGSLKPSCLIVCSDDFWDDRCGPRCTPGSSDPRCGQSSSIIECYPGSTDPNCPVICTAEFRDRRCRTVPSPVTKAPKLITEVQPIPIQPGCYPGSIDPNCPLVCTAEFRDRRCKAILTTTTEVAGVFTEANPIQTQSRCYPGSTDSNCPLICSEEFKDIRCEAIPITTTETAAVFKAASPSPTQSPCYPGSSDPSCPVICTEKFSDVRCNTRPPATVEPFRVFSEVTPRTNEPGCYPGRPDPTCPIICTSEFRDLRCDPPSVPTTETSKFITEENTNPPQPKCFPGSLERNCPIICTEDFQDTRCSPPPILPQIVTTPKPIVCLPGSQDPSCEIVCNEDFTDPRCAESEYLPPDSQRCRPDSTDPSCLENCDTNPTSPECQTKTDECTPGSLDPNCPIVCTDEFRDTRCLVPTQRPSPTNPPAKLQITECFPGSRDPTCPVICNTDFQDERCDRPESKLEFDEEPFLSVTEFEAQRETTTRAITNYPSSTRTTPPRKVQKIETTTRATTPVPARTTTSPTLQCYPGSRNRNCPIICDINFRDDRCAALLTTPSCFPGSRDPACPIVCDKTFRDDRCLKEVPASQCLPGTKDPGCQTPETNILTTEQPCFPGSLNPNCPVICSEEFHDTRCPTTPYVTESRTTQSPTRQSTSARCSPGSTNPGCPIICNEEFWDDRCLRPTTRAPCFPGSQDTECPVVCTTEFWDDRCGPRIAQQPLTTKPKDLVRCFPGSLDPACPIICDDSFLDSRCLNKFPEPAKEPETTTTRCFPGSRDPACRRVISEPPNPCKTNPNAPGCRKQPTRCQGPLYDENCYDSASPIPAPSCYYGTPDPACQEVCSGELQSTYCPQAAPQVLPGRAETTRKPVCLPGSRTRPCRTEETKQKPRCQPGSTEPECKVFESQPNEPKTFISTSTTASPLRSQGSKEWTGDSKNHAFHKFHYQKGDGRRNERIFGKIGKIGKPRSKRSEAKVAHARLTTGFRIRSN